MRHLAAALVLAAALSGCATTDRGAADGRGGAPATGAGGASEMVAEKPRYELGDKWIRSDGVYDLVRVVEGSWSPSGSQDSYVFVGTNGREIKLGSDLMVRQVSARGAPSSAYEWELPGSSSVIPWPLTVGATESGHLSLYVGKTLHGKYESRVEAVETVRVAAGSFQAFRIVITIEVDERVLRDYGNRAPGWFWQTRTYAWRITTWYAPAIRQFVKSSTAGFGLGALAYEVVAVDDASTNRIAVRLPTLEERETPTSHPQYTVTGSAFAGRGLQHVRVTADDTEVFTTEGRVLGQEIPLQIPLKLREGRTVVRVSVRDVSGETVEQTRVIVYTPDAVAHAPKPAPPVVAMVPPPAPTPAPPSPPPPPVAVAPPPLPPLTIAIATPRDRAEVDADRITLAGVVSGGPGVRRVVVSLNGQDVTRVDDGRPQPNVPLNVLLPLRDGYNTVVVTVTDAAGIAHQDVRTVRFERPTPLTVDVRYPQDGGKFTEAATVLAVVARSSKGIASTRVTLNGVELADPDERPGGRRDLTLVSAAPRRPATVRRSVALTLPLTLRPGRNVLAVAVSEPDGTTRQVVRTVTYEPPKVKPVVATAPTRPQPRRWAVIIGIGKYENPGVPRLRYTVPDAQAVYDLLTGPGGFKKDEVLLLTDTTDRKPTYRNIKWALGTFLARSAAKDDTVVVFFAGHGAPEIDQRGVERDGLAKYLVPSDADPDDLYATALPMDELQIIFSRIEAERVVMFLDACYSGAAGGRTFAAKSTRAVGLDDVFLERLAKAKGRAIVTASRPSEVSIELAQLGHGVFTYYLVEGLKGAADADRDGIVTLDELYAYLTREVTAKARAAGGNQHPVMKGELEGILPLMQVPK